MDFREINAARKIQTWDTDLTVYRVGQEFAYRIELPGRSVTEILWDSGETYETPVDAKREGEGNREYLMNLDLPEDRTF